MTVAVWVWIAPVARVPSSCQPVPEEEKTEALCTQVASCVTFGLCREDGTSDAAACVAADRVQGCQLDLRALAAVSGKTHSRLSRVCACVGAIGHSALPPMTAVLLHVLHS